MPYKSIRQIDEGGHTKDIETEFDQNKEEAFVVDNKKHKTENTFTLY
jgi:hypothetical protein